MRVNPPPPPPHLSALLVIGQSTNKQKKLIISYTPPPPDISPPLACLEMNSIFYDILKLKKLSKFKKYLITAILLV